MNQLNQRSCHSNCFAMFSAGHYWSTQAPNYHKAVIRFTSWYYFGRETNNHVHIFFLTIEGDSQGKFYYIVNDVAFGPGQLFHCKAFPDQSLQILYSQNMLVHLPLKIETVTKLKQKHAELIAYNFKQDCKIFNELGMSYEKYMDRIILNLIEKQDKAINVNAIKVRTRDYGVDSSVVDGIVTSTKGNCIHSDAGLLPKLFAFHEKQDDIQYITDFNDPDKDRGFLSLQETKFEFISLDRDFCEYNTIDQVMNIADIIKATGLPNYKQARFPIKSNLNLPAWGKYLIDYLDQRIIQYLKFGFPLSLTDPDSIHDMVISNHFSALLHHKAIEQYLDKEKAYGAILGPFTEVP